MIILAADGFSAVYTNLHVYICGLGTRQVIDLYIQLAGEVENSRTEQSRSLCGVPEVV